MLSKGVVAAIVIAVAVHYSGVVEIPAVARVDANFFSSSPAPPLDQYKLHRLLAEGAMNWDDSTTDIPISNAAYLAKFILSETWDKVPTDLVKLRHDLKKDDTVIMERVRYHVAATQLLKLQEICKPESCPGINLKDPVYGMTPLHIARAHGNNPAIIKVLLAAQADEGIMDNALRLPLNLTFTNFIANTKKWTHAINQECELPVVDFSKGDGAANVAEVRRLVNEGEPLLIRNIMQSMDPTFIPFNIDEFVAKNGDSQVKVGDVPYAGYFGKSTNKMTLRQFYNDHVTSRDPDTPGHSLDPSFEPPLYAFEKNGKALTEIFSMVGSWVKATFPVPSLIEDPLSLDIANLHYALGAKFSGAPFHMHGDALNVVFVGQKRWFVTPPSSSIYSRKPIGLWMQEDYPALKDQVLTCVQREGDGIYVPFDWAHSVLNEGHPTFAIALELLNKRETFHYLRQL